jgi:hypothetical protein
MLLKLLTAKIVSVRKQKKKLKELIKLLAPNSNKLVTTSYAVRSRLTTG